MDHSQVGKRKPVRRIIVLVTLAAAVCVLAVSLGVSPDNSTLGAAISPTRVASDRLGPAAERAAAAGVSEMVGNGDRSAVAWDPKTGLWGNHIPPNWWQSALALQTLVRYLERSHNVDPSYQHVLLRIYQINVYRPKSPAPRNFADKFNDDTAWWALAWLEASRYELADRHDRADAAAFLAVAEWDARYIATRPKACGGVEWQLGYPPDTITAAEYVALMAQLARYRSAAGPFHDSARATRWLSDARSAMAWMERTGLIRVRRGTVVDRLKASCRGYLGGATTYTQGEVAEALTQLGLATHDRTLFAQARRFLRFVATPRHGLISRQGILQEHCEVIPGGCSSLHDHYDFPAFKGIYVNAVADWSAATHSRAFVRLLRTQADAVLRNATDVPGDGSDPCTTAPTCQFGAVWTPGSSHSPNAIMATIATQESAIDALTAVLPAR